MTIRLVPSKVVVWGALLCPGIVHAQTISNADVLKLDSDSARMAAVGAAMTANFDLGPIGLQALKAAHVGDSVIVAMFQKKNDDLTNQSLVLLTVAGVSPEQIIRLIRGTEPNKAKLDASSAGIVGLRGAMVDRSVIQAVVQKINPIIDPDQDIPVLAALGARISGGVIIGNDRVKVTPGTTNSSGIATPASFESNQFSQAASYLAFEAQPLWQPNATHKRLNHLGVSPVVNVRLTSIAVTQATEVAAPSNDFLKAQKVVQFQFGGVIDVHGPTFTLGGSNFRWALGYVGRYMPQSVTDGDRAGRIWNFEDDLYSAQTHGARLSLFQEQNVVDGKQWRPAAYVDFSWGRFENFETASVKSGLSAADNDKAQGCLKDPQSCFSSPPSKTLFDTFRPSRLYVESRVMLKYVYLGFDINNGSGRDDVRFIGGVTITLDRFFKSSSR